jgi:hypothetical protein
MRRQTCQYAICCTSMAQALTTLMYAQFGSLNELCTKARYKEVLKLDALIDEKWRRLKAIGLGPANSKSVRVVCRHCLEIRAVNTTYLKEHLAVLCKHCPHDISKSMTESISGHKSLRCGSQKRASMRKGDLSSDDDTTSTVKRDPRQVASYMDAPLSDTRIVAIDGTLHIINSRLLEFISSICALVQVSLQIGPFMLACRSKPSKI